MYEFGLIKQQLPSHALLHGAKSRDVSSLVGLRRPVGIIAVIMVAENRKHPVWSLYPRQRVDKRNQFGRMTVDYIACKHHRIGMQTIDNTDKLPHKPVVITIRADMEI